MITAASLWLALAGPWTAAPSPPLLPVTADTVHLQVGSPEIDGRFFPVHLAVEGTEVTAWKVEERRRATGQLLATWYLTDHSPYMVLGEVPLADGRVQRMTGVDLPLMR